MSAAMHFFDESVHRPLPMCQRRYFNHTFDRRHYPNRTIACGLCFIWQPSFFRNYSAGCSRHSIDVFFNPLLLRIDNKFINYHHQTEVPSLKDFSKILTLALISFITQQFIQGRRKIDNWGGGVIFIYSCSQTVKTIDFKI